MPRVYLSPSMQQSNIGVGNYGSEERRMNEIVDFMEPILKRHEVMFFRNKPEMTHITAKDDSNRIGVDAHIAIHSDAGGGRGCTVFSSGTSKSRILSNYLYKEVSSISPTEDRGVRITSDLTEVVKTHAPACLIEVSYHDNFDQALWIIENEKAIAKAICKGILRFFNIEYQEEFIPQDLNHEFYQVVAGSFRKKENAEARVKSLAMNGFDSFITVKK